MWVFLWDWDGKYSQGGVKHRWLTNGSHWFGDQNNEVVDMVLWFSHPSIMDGNSDTVASSQGSEAEAKSGRASKVFLLK